MHGLDLLLAEAAVKNSEGAVLIAGAVQNPVATATTARAFTYQWTKSSDFDCNSFGAVCTPEFFVYGPDRRLAYHGRLDDSGREPAKVTRRDLAAAFDALLAGRAPAAAQVASIGCSIARS